MAAGLWHMWWGFQITHGEGYPVRTLTGRHWLKSGANAVPQCVRYVLFSSHFTDETKRDVERVSHPRYKRITDGAGVGALAVKFPTESPHSPLQTNTPWQA